MTRTIPALLRLSRWKEHILFTVPLTLLGIDMAARHHELALDYRLPAVLMANILAVTCAFMVNDAEDAPDDAREADRRARNPVATGELTRQQGWLAAILVSLAALALFALTKAFWVGLLMITLAYLYSWRGVRLKAYPVVDILSHAMMLSSLLFLAGYLAYDPALGSVWFVVLGVGLISAYGQLYNQLRDETMDRAAGLHNTASLIGPRLTQRLMYACLILAGINLLISVGLGLWPLWLALVPVILSPIFFVFRGSTDMRGTKAIDQTGRIQLQFMIVANGVALIWLAATF